MLTHNPLLCWPAVPDFSQIQAEHVLPAIEIAIADHRKVMDKCVGQPGDPAILREMAMADAMLHHAWGTVEHLVAICNTPPLRHAHGEAEAMISAYQAALGQNRALYDALRAMDPARLPDGHRRAHHLAVQSFEMSGVGLDEEAARQFAQSRVAASEMSTGFANAVLDATQAWHYDVTDAQELAGVPDVDRQAMAAAARAAGVKGWRITLQFPCVMAISGYAQDRALRRKVYEARNTLASDCGPHAGQFDNSARMEQLLAIRAAQAAQLGYADAAEAILATRMAPDGAGVEAFLLELAHAAKPQAKRELAALEQFAKDHLGLSALEAWDIPFASEQMRRQLHDLDADLIRQHLPLDRVLAALFGVIGQLYGLEMRETPVSGAWHADVRQFQLYRPDGAEPIAAVMADFFARDGKRGGAWMSVCRPRLEAGRIWPVAHLVTNFAAPLAGRSPTISHQDMITLFHEMGHCLHLLLTQAELPSVAGYAGVEWDAVELPSQFMEDFAWEPAVLKAASAHEKTGEPLSDAMIERMQGARRFMGGMGLLRQVELALYDMRLHRQDGDAALQPADVLQAVRAEVAVIRYPDWNRMGHAFTHIFAGGYGAGYYSYLWAERLSADAYAAFTEPMADRALLGARFREEILEKGGTRSALENYIAFRGRAPDNAALLARWGVEPLAASA